MTLSPGTQLGPYEILSPLGAGGMGEVYRARDTRLGREIAIKVLPQSIAQDAEALARFEREARAVAALSHPNILALHDFGNSESTAYAVTELLEGETLRDRLGAGGLSLRKAVDYGIQTMNGLAAAHDRGIIHRDLKPENLFITHDGRVKILDFGLARIERVASDPELSSAPTVAQKTEPGTVMGTVGYMSPEQVRGKPVDHRTDIFSFGAVLYEMLTGERAFRGASPVETMNAILNAEPPETFATGKSVTADLDRIVRHCLEKSPVERFQSARDVAFDLQAHSGGSTATGSRALPARNRAAARRWAPAAGAVVVLLAAFFAGRLSRPPATPLARVHAHRVTFRRGIVPCARFAPDGQTIVYTASWEGRLPAVFTTRLDMLGERPSDIPNADVLAVSPRGELALLLNVQHREEGDIGTLARQPLSGGAPRELLENVTSADWAPNGEDLAIVREIPAKAASVLEYPIGHLLLEGQLISDAHVSPTGERVAFVASSESEKGFAIRVTDRKGGARTLTGGWFGLRLAWSPDGREIVFSGYREPGDRRIAAVDLTGRERVLLPAAELRLHDVFPDGRILAQRVNSRAGISIQSAGGQERDLSWMDASWVSDISRDGRTIVFTDGSTGSDFGVYLRPTDGSPAVRLGTGENPSLSPDGKWVAALRRGAATELVLLPAGAGTAKARAIEHLVTFAFLPDGRILLARAADRGSFAFSVTTADGSRTRPLELPDVSLESSAAFSPDGRKMAYAAIGGQIRTVPFDGGGVQAVPGPGLNAGEGILQWSEDGKALFVSQQQEMTMKISRIDLASGERALWREVRPSDPTGVEAFGTVVMTPDGKSIAYSCRRTESAGLYVLEGLLKGRASGR